MVANYANGKRRFDSYAEATEALDAANRLARQLSKRDVVAAQLTNEEAAAYAAAIQSLDGFNVTLPAAADTLKECLKIVGNLPNLLHASKFYVSRHPSKLPKKTVAEVVSECLAAKKNSGAGDRYLSDLKYRLNRFAQTFRISLSSVTGDQIQDWLDSEKLSPQSRINFRRVLNLFFEFAKRRGYLPKDWDELDRLEKVKANKSRKIEIFTPDQMTRLLKAADPKFLPSLAIGAFAGLRSAELEKLEWKEVNLRDGFVEVTAKKAKTASRRLVLISENLAGWLAPYAQKTGKVWGGGKTTICDAQNATAKAAKIKWKQNALRHSFISYRLAILKDAAQVALEAGNSVGIIFGHYRELVRPEDAERWFSITPGDSPPNVLPMSDANSAARS